MIEDAGSPAPAPKPVRCPFCFRTENVRPFSIGLVGNRYLNTVEYECSACARVFKPSTLLALKVLS